MLFLVSLPCHVEYKSVQVSEWSQRVSDDRKFIVAKLVSIKHQFHFLDALIHKTARNINQTRFCDVVACYLTRRG